MTPNSVADDQLASGAEGEPNVYDVCDDSGTFDLEGPWVLGGRVNCFRNFQNKSPLLLLPTRLLWFADEDHWVLKAPNSRQWYGEVFSWIEEHQPQSDRKKRRG